MLVLTRKTREQIQIGENIVITILKVKGQTVRVGIEAPREVRVLRSELPKDESATGEDVDNGTNDAACHQPLQTATRNSRRVSTTGMRSAKRQRPILIARPSAPTPTAVHCHAAAVRSAGPLSTLG